MNTLESTILIAREIGAVEQLDALLLLQNTTQQSALDGAVRSQIFADTVAELGALEGVDYRVDGTLFVGVTVEYWLESVDITDYCHGIPAPGYRVFEKRLIDGRGYHYCSAGVQYNFEVLRYELAPLDGNAWPDKGTPEHDAVIEYEADLNTTCYESDGACARPSRDPEIEYVENATDYYAALKEIREYEQCNCSF